MTNLFVQLESGRIININRILYIDPNRDGGIVHFNNDGHDWIKIDLDDFNQICRVLINDRSKEQSK